MNSTTIDFTEDTTPVAITHYYDRGTRSYIAYLVDEDGFQVGEARYDGTKADHAVSLRDLEAELPR